MTHGFEDSLFPKWNCECVCKRTQPSVLKYLRLDAWPSLPMVTNPDCCLFGQIVSGHVLVSHIEGVMSRLQIIVYETRTPFFLFICFIVVIIFILE